MSDTANNHLIVGLGGTGGKVLRSLRKTIFQNLRSDNPDGVKLAYLYVDSSDAMMAADDATWKILGRNVQLSQQSQLKITGLNLSDVLDNVNDFPGISPWLGNRDYFRSIIRGADSANIVGGQKRRLGRFLFACKALEYRTRLQALVRDLQTGNTTDVTFHFVLGLAGGTGSGCLIDAICQARALFPTNDYRILIYALLPDKNPKPNRAGVNYHANGYAALQELNALAVGAYLPIDVSGTQKQRLDLKDPFNACYVFTDENEDKNRVDLDTELLDVVASFLFQKIVNTKDLVWKTADGDPIKRQERFEIGSQADEQEKSPASGRPERTRRFFAFGTRQIAYPEEEIREYLTYTFAQQASLQLLFNNFAESLGFVDQAVPHSFNELVRNPEVQQRWLIAEDNLTLSIGIIADERNNNRWKPIPKFWQDILPNLKTFVQDNFKDEQHRWLSELSKLFEVTYEQNFRDLGVRRFYEVKRGEQADHCREIRRAIEADLFGDWLNGTKSIEDVSRVVAALLGALSERRSQLEEAITKNKNLESQTSRRADANGVTWAKINPLSQLFGARQRLFDAQGETLRELFVLRTQGQGLQFARALIDAVISEVTDLGNECARTRSTITTASQTFASAVAERLSDAGQSNVQTQVVRFYKPDSVKDFAKSLTRNEEQQRFQTAAVREAIGSFLGEVPSFAVFNARINVQQFRDILEATSEFDVIKAHDAVMSSDSTRERILRVNVLDRLEKEYGGNRDALRSYLAQIVSKSRTQIVFNPAEVARTVPGNEGLEKMFQFSTVIVPEGRDQAAFRSVLIDELNNAIVRPHEIASNPQRPNEITVINVTSAFPARFVQDVQFLKDRYDARVAGADAGQARFELHTEGDGTDWPSLFLRRITKEDVLPLLLLADAMKIVQTIEDPQTGVVSVYLVTKDVRGRDNAPRRLGKDYPEAAESLDVVTFDELETAVKAQLGSEFLRKDRRSELYDVVHKTVDAACAQRTNPLDPIRVAYTAADRTVEALLELDGR